MYQNCFDIHITMKHFTKFTIQQYYHSNQYVRVTSKDFFAMRTNSPPNHPLSNPLCTHNDRKDSP